MIPFEQALSIVQEKISVARPGPQTESVRLDDSAGRILAGDVAADRDYPPFDRAIRDGFAVRAADLASLPTVLRLHGEVRAGQHFEGEVQAGECVSIMTGAPVPSGADSVVMMEYAESRGDGVEIRKSVHSGENLVSRGSEVKAGERVLERGQRLGPGEIGLLATVGKNPVAVFTKPRVAVLATGDELVPVKARPKSFQIRNSNALTLGALVTDSGGTPLLLGVAPDRVDELRTLIQEGLSADLLLLSGGISVGKYDYVARVLAELGAEFYFQGVALRPGKPLAFGCVGKKPFFALPGNPISTFVTFTLFARPALSALGGAAFAPALFLRARLGESCSQKGQLSVFLPARVEQQGSEPVVSPVKWQGSGDLVALARANCFLVLHPHETHLNAGEWVNVLPKAGCG